MKSKVVLTVGIVMISLMSLMTNVSAQEVRAYMGLSAVNTKLVENFIKEKTGIQLLETPQSFGEIEAKVRSEAPNFNADMVTGCGSPLAFMAKKNKWAVPYNSPTWKGVGPEFIDTDKYWFNTSNFLFVFVGNKDKLKEKGYSMPQKWNDLLDPKWKDQLVVPSPLSSGTAYQIVYTVLALYGEEKGWQFLEALDKNIHHYCRSGNAPTDLVGRGEFLIGITSHENVKTRIDQGYPLLWTVPEEGTGYDGTFAFIFNTTKKMKECQNVIDAMGSQEFSKMMGGLGYVTPHPAPNALFGDNPPKLAKLDLVWTVDNKPRFIDIWKQKFMSKIR